MPNYMRPGGTLTRNNYRSGVIVASCSIARGLGIRLSDITYLDTAAESYFTTISERITAVTCGETTTS